jgi:aspartyl-tRNA(Asn)/glutamyl-tRNA(Gln) amidotransferase subunit B
VLAESIRSQRPAGELVAERGFAQVSDESALEAIVREVIATNSKAAADYQAGKKQALGALMADLKKKAPQANPKVANELLQRLLR